MIVDLDKYYPSRLKLRRSIMGKSSVKLVSNNKKAYHDYFIEEKYEAGISLAGTEVKSLRMGKCSLKESFIRVENGELFIYGMHISPYEKGNIFNKDPLRVRKLLLHRHEINRIARSEEHTSELQSRFDIVCRLLLEKNTTTS